MSKSISERRLKFITNRRCESPLAERRSNVVRKIKPERILFAYPLQLETRSRRCKARRGAWGLLFSKWYRDMEQANSRTILSYRNSRTAGLTNWLWGEGPTTIVLWDVGFSHLPGGQNPPGYGT
jgi:hypothetical protein